jgi:hypothetical protein
MIHYFIIYLYIKYNYGRMKVMFLEQIIVMVRFHKSTATLEVSATACK